MTDCRNCDFNTYKDAGTSDWMSCCHPTAIRKLAKWEPGDPAIISYRTADVPIRDIQYMADCSAWAPLHFGDLVGGSRE